MIQLFANVLVSSMTLALLALAIGLVYQSSRMFHLSLCGIYVVVPLVLWSSLRRGFGLPVALTLSITLGLAISVVSYLFIHGPLQRRQASAEAQFVAALGGYLCIVQTAVLLFGNETRMLTADMTWAFKMGAVGLTRTQLLTLAAAPALFVLFTVLVKASRLGLKLRAQADNPAQFQLAGFSVRRLQLTAFAISGTLCAASSLLTGAESGIDPNGGFAAGLPAIVALIIGGRTLVAGPLVGGLVIGTLRTAVVWYVSASWQDAATFAALAVFLLVRPGGLTTGNTHSS